MTSLAASIAPSPSAAFRLPPLFVRGGASKRSNIKKAAAPPPPPPATSGDEGGFSDGMRILFLALGVVLLLADLTLNKRVSFPSGVEKERTRVLIIGASGAIGKELVATISATRGPSSVVAALRKTPLPAALVAETGVVSEFGVDLRNASSVEAVVSKYADELFAVWNLAAPLSVESEQDPSLAEDVTVGGEL
jgi:hypothetical protein